MVNNVENSSFPLISALILSYNRCSVLCSTIEHLYETKYPNLEIIVIDNASTDRTVEVIYERYPSVLCVPLNENKGVSALNEGMKIARGDYFLILDDDSYPFPNSLLAVRKYLADDTILSLKILTPTGEWDTPYFNEDYQIHSFVECGVIIPKRIYNEIGGFEPLLFLYHNEYDFALRAVDKGYKLKYLDNVTICHLRLNKGKYSKRDFDPRFYYYSTRNSIIILLMRFSFLKVLGRVIRFVAGRLLFALIRGKMSITLKAFADALSCVVVHWHKRTIVSPSTQKYYEYGKLVSSFFGDGTHALRKPYWL